MTLIGDSEMAIETKIGNRRTEMRTPMPYSDVLTSVVKSSNLDGAIAAMIPLKRGRVSIDLEELLKVGVIASGIATETETETGLGARARLKLIQNGWTLLLSRRRRLLTRRKISSDGRKSMAGARRRRRQQWRRPIR
jgi:hypothetical protein